MARTMVPPKTWRRVLKDRRAAFYRLLGDGLITTTPFVPAGAFDVVDGLVRMVLFRVIPDVRIDVRCPGRGR
jgi:hypothetical protein